MKKYVAVEVVVEKISFDVICTSGEFEGTDPWGDDNYLPLDFNRN